MRYLPHTDSDVAAMLAVIGVRSLEELFSPIPDDCRLRGPLTLPEPLNEWELEGYFELLSNTTAAAQGFSSFIGAGSYDHFIPESNRQLLSRSEFYTAYTPYQPEISQGTLQAIYEYQTLTARLMQMEVANASLYDGASSLAEALLMSIRITKKPTVAISRSIHPHYRRVAQTYFAPTGYSAIELPHLSDGRTDYSSLQQAGEVAAVVVQSPNFFGVIEDLDSAAEAARAHDALLIVSFTEPLAYGILKPPGKYGADIACGEGQSLGIPQSFGGPGLGIFASKMQYVRNMPGRLVGRAQDVEGRGGYVLTLATREQHIRRQKATSNICTNSSLCALAAAMYMATLGKTGFREMAQLNHDKAEYLKDRLREKGCELPFSGPTFNEFVVRFPNPGDYRRLLERKVLAGLPLDAYYPELKDHHLLCVTETKSRSDLDALAEEVGR
ncbi:MAG: aminomethyl-transferring glycine dehydrogenase subunit GcvPA [Candidatus Abyssobacteria bacterium SURF_5]|uniref:Probable glycine dehydrogenase (decarboxylating) subunit 1 n=1 Tax=Abyssobacteria bacterium (strain SURF_5) TaxID=2093360 RepID=A0A3A4NPP4_ABYX5|nr:MAG: aminomethyl-transferring glycine dehydrogenase subunit GcvPA [Candidatus Abyssubacteria bacterium SURF_5]